MAALEKVSDGRFAYPGVRTLCEAAPPGRFMTHAMLILAGEDEFVLIDAGYAERADLAISWIQEEAGGRLDALLLTHHHSDHIGGAEALCEAFGPPVYMHPVEAELAAERAPGLSPNLLEDGAIARFGSVALRVVLTPGHAPGHIAFWWEERRILFGGDNVLLPVTTWVGPPRGNLADYLESLKKMRALAPALIYPGHGPPVEDPVGRIDAILRHRQRREEQVLEALAEGLDTPERMSARIYEGLGDRQREMGTKVLIAHLEKLIAEGRVRREGDRYAPAD